MPVVSAQDFVSSSFDYLIIGGGTAGLTLAARLSENPDTIVGVIEAGTHETDVSRITVPGMMGSCIADATYDWSFISTPQAHANDRVIFQPRGKGLGGCSLINFMGMARPSKEEFDALEQLGNKGWNWNSMLKYMKKSESTSMPEISTDIGEKFAMRPNPDYHGTEGSLKKSLPINLIDLHKDFLDTTVALGFKKNYDSNAGRLVGAVTTWTSVDPKTATRSSSKSAFFEPNARRPNLLVVTSALVSKILFEEQNDGHRAIGVEFVTDGSKMKAINVKKDIVLSAGTFQTPQILELSGVGNPEILKRSGIETILNIPAVGENLQDHVYVPTVAEIDSKTETIDVVFDGGLAEQQALYEKQQGFLSTISAPAFLYVPASKLGSSEEMASLQAAAECSVARMIDTNTLPALRKGLRKQLQFQKAWFESDLQASAEIIHYSGHQPIPGLTACPGKRYSTLIACIMHPMSRGTVHIATSDPKKSPAINPNYFDNVFDLELLYRTLRLALKVYKAGPFGIIFRNHVLPSAQILDGKLSDEVKETRLKTWIKEWFGPVWHPVGTASMLPQEDGGVVDETLKVYGTTNLRIVDCSILPIAVSGHIQSAAYAIAEKAADMMCS